MFKNVRCKQITVILTRILPVVVCPDISSPAQSLASVMKVPSNSCFPSLAAFCSFCLGSFGPRSVSLLQQRKAKSLHTRTISSPAKKVQMEDKRKHQYFLSSRQGSVVVGMVEETFWYAVQAAESPVIPCYKASRRPRLITVCFYRGSRIRLRDFFLLHYKNRELPRTTSNLWYNWITVTWKLNLHAPFVEFSHALQIAGPESRRCRTRSAFQNLWLLLVSVKAFAIYFIYFFLNVFLFE